MFLPQEAKAKPWQHHSHDANRFSAGPVLIDEQIWGTLDRTNHIPNGDLRQHESWEAGRGHKIMGPES